MLNENSTLQEQGCLTMQESKETECKFPSALQIKPLNKSQRVDALDILRGLALVGILLMNIEWFNRAVVSLGAHATTLSGFDHAIGWLIRCFVEGKFYKLFALIFGMGFAAMLLRAKEVGRPFGAWFSRRMFVLWLIGIAHMIFLWGGDILHDYALAGFILLAWVSNKQTDNPNAYLKLALTWAMIPIIIASVVGVIFGTSFDDAKFKTTWQNEFEIHALVEQQLSNELDTAAILKTPDGSYNETTQSDTETKDPIELTDEEVKAQAVADLVEQRKEMQTDIAKEDAAFTQKSYWEATKYRLGFTGFMVLISPVISLLVLVPIFILGFWLVITEKIIKHQQHQEFFKTLMYTGLSLGIPLNIASLLIIQHPAALVSDLLQVVGQLLFYIAQCLLSAGYLGLVICALNKKRWLKFLYAFSPMGQMALTNYLMQSIVLSLIFYGYAGGQYGEISRTPQMLIVLVIILSQLFFSQWWLNRYRFGPMEWLWRSLTYKEIQVMKK